MKLRLLHAGRYDYRQTSIQVTHAAFLSLTVSGLEKSVTTTPGGKYFFTGHDHQLQLTPPGCRNSFSFSAKRENFVVICDIPELELDEESGMLWLNQQPAPFRFAPVLPLDHTMTMHYRTVFERIIRLKNSPVPANIFMAEQLAAMLVGELACAPVNNSFVAERNVSAAIAERLKTLLDEDMTFNINLNDLCRKIGCSQEHARRIFHKHFGITPIEYRLRRKLERICLLLQDPELSMKEIASEVGMNNVTHLYAFIRRRCGTTPGELLKKLSH